MDLLYLAGPPCVGKSTLMTALTAWCERVQADQPVAHVRLIDPATGRLVGAELGRDRGEFSGTDALPMAISPVACMWLQRGDGPGLLLGEGDRLAHMGFLQSATAGGYTVTLVHLDAPGDLLDMRCGWRGSNQNESWRRGRATKAARLADAAAAAGLGVVRLDAAYPVGELARRLRAAVPALRALPARDEVAQ